MYDELTEVDIRKMQEEIHYRTTVLRPKIMEDVKTARAFGDLSENYEYKAAKQEQRRCDSRLRYLKPVSYTHLDVYKRQVHFRPAVCDASPERGL